MKRNLGYFFSAMIALQEMVYVLSDALRTPLDAPAREVLIGERNALRNYDASWQPEKYQRLGKSGLPVLVLWGTADTIDRFEQSQTIQSWVPQAELIALTGKPHAITFGEAPLLIAHILPFWNAHSAHQVAQSELTRG